MRVLGIVGWSGSGKTTLIEEMIPLIRARGLTVSTIKHAHHGFDIDQKGKDSYRHREAGAQEVLIATDTRWVLMHEKSDSGENDLNALLARLSPCDIVLVEGFKADSIAKLEVWNGRGALLAASDPEIGAVIPVETSAPDCAYPVLSRNDVNAIVDWALKAARAIS